MPRKSQRISSGSVAASKHKRAASNSTPLSAESKDSKKLKATPTKSEYFEGTRKRVEAVEDEQLDIEPSSPDEEDVSEFGDEPESSASDAENDDEYGSDSEQESKKRKKPTPRKEATSSAAIRTKGNELLKPGVKTGLGPGTQVVIKKPKARAAGKTPYEDETIHPNTLLFLKDLKANNERQWLKSESSLSNIAIVKPPFRGECNL